MRIDESDSDDDPDIANQSLSQSMMLAQQQQQQVILKSFNDPGFLNVAMQELLRDELRKDGQRAVAVQASADEESELERSHR